MLHRRFLLVLAMVAACKGSHNQTGDAGVPDGAPDAPPDAPTDAGPVCQLGLTPVPWLDVEHAPARAAVADVNRDGIPDVLVGSQDDATIHVWLGTGGGRFRPGMSYAMHGGAAGAVGLALADLDHDGLLDLVVASGDLIVQLGHGDGTFGDRIVVPAGCPTGAVTLGDVSGDGKPDAVVACSQGKVGVLLGHGDGTFSAAVSYAATPNPTPAVIADLSGDGKPDLVVGSVFNGKVGVLLGHGDGSFQPDVDYDLPHVAASIAVGDLDGDGALDVVAIANNLGGDEPHNATVLFGHNDGSLTFLASSEAGAAVVAVALADVNGDGRPDVVTTHDLFNAVDVGLGTATGPSFVASAQVGGFPTSSVLADLDGDGVLDLIVPNPSSNNVSIELGNGDGSFRDTPHGGPVAFYLLADLDGDGVLDAVGPRLAFGQQPPSGLFVQLGAGGGSFRAPVDVAVTAPPIDVVAGDVDHDGVLDLIELTSSATESVLRGNGDGTFQPGIDLAATGVSAIAVGDLNGDGKADLVESRAGSTPILRVQLGDGDGHFHAGGDVALPGAPGPLALADLDGDGVLDLAVITGDDGLRVMLGNGDGTFRLKLDAPTGIAPHEVIAVDLNGDGKRDLVLAGHTDADGDFLRVMLGNGDGTFTTKGDTAVTFAGAVAVADLTGDGVPDVVSYSFDIHTLDLLVGNGDGTLAPRIEFGGVGTLPTRLAIADVTGDGHPDVLLSGGSLFAPACLP